MQTYLSLACPVDRVCLYEACAYSTCSTLSTSSCHQRDYSFERHYAKCKLKCHLRSCLLNSTTAIGACCCRASVVVVLMSVLHECRLAIWHSTTGFQIASIRLFYTATFYFTRRYTSELTIGTLALLAVEMNWRRLVRDMITARLELSTQLLLLQLQHV